jgi:putative transposase
MTNHVHLLITATHASSPARMMQMLGRSYVRYFNDRHERTGTLWEGRYRSTLVDCERYFLTCSRYVESNPVRAGMVERPDLYRWSSFRCNADGAPDALVTPHPVYMALGKGVWTRRDAYRALFSSALDPDELDAIRRATNRGTVLGSTRYREMLEEAVQRRLSRLSHGGIRRRPTASPPDDTDARTSSDFNDADPLISTSLTP